jgi:hypothetical protein
MSSSTYSQRKGGVSETPWLTAVDAPLGGRALTSWQPVISRGSAAVIGWVSTTAYLAFCLLIKFGTVQFNTTTCNKHGLGMREVLCLPFTSPDTQFPLLWDALIAPQHSCEALTPNTSECDSIWRQSWKESLGGPNSLWLVFLQKKTRIQTATEEDPVEM